ncbi:hypothetical protein [Vulcanisaeta distributa]|nr:hypothetical protein [Vulcanisaeta distributa]
MGGVEFIGVDLDSIDGRLRAVIDYAIKAWMGVEVGGESVRGLFSDDVDYRLFTGLGFRDLAGIAVSRHYAVLVMGVGEHYHPTYVVGVNDGGKLFINGGGWAYADHCSAEPSFMRHFLSGGALRVVGVDDSEVKGLLGFDLDAGYEGVDLGSALGSRVRVRGDLVLQVLPIEDYVDEITRAAEEQYVNAASHVIMRRAMNALDKYGIAATLDGDVLMVEASGLGGDVNSILNEIAKLLARDLVIDDMLTNGHPDVEVKRVASDWVLVHYGYSGLNEWFLELGVRYMEYLGVGLITIKPTAQPSGCRYVVGCGDLPRLVRESLWGGEGVQEVDIGGYEITYHGLPRSVTLSLKPSFMGKPLMITANAEPSDLGVTRDLVIEHPRHGTYKAVLTEARMIRASRVTDTLTPYKNALRLRKMTAKAGGIAEYALPQGVRGITLGINLSRPITKNCDAENDE